jgi:hypothetical protein
MLNQIDESLNSGRLDVVNNFKIPLFKAVEILKERYVQSNYVQK